MYIYLSARYLTHFTSDKNNDIFEKIKILRYKVVLSREDYNKAISDYREKLKVDAINVLESLTADDKEVAMMLKKNGIIKTYDSYMDNPDNLDTNNDPVVNYQGDDNNDQPLY
jgi:spore coat protein CotH